jgi:accessory gene regulator protein AgrB
MRYLELILYAFAKFVIWYSVVLLFGIVAVEVATCPAQNRFVKSERSGATATATSLAPMQFFGSFFIRAGRLMKPAYAIRSYLGAEGLPHRSL